MADRYTYRGEEKEIARWGDMISRRLRRLKNQDIVRRGGGPWWIFVPEHLRNPDRNKARRIGIAAIFQFVPNSQLWNKRVTNFTRLPTRLLELKFGIAYEDDVRRAKEVLEQMVSEETRVLDEPAPQVLVYELGDSALVLAVRVWTKTSDYWAARWALTEAGKLRLETAGLSIPFPQRDVHIVGGAPSPDNQSAA
jgi:hypothetical protein